MSVVLRSKPNRRKLPSVPGAKGLSWVGEEGVTITGTRIKKPDLDRFARLPPHILAQLKKVENDRTIIPGQKFTDIPVTDDVDHDKTTSKGRSVSIELQRDTFRRIAGIREFADVRDSYKIRKIDIRKSPEKSLGFYICEGDGWNRQDGIFVSRLVLGSYIEANNFLRVGDEILKVNEVYVKNFSLNDVALMMQVVEKLVLTVKVLTSISHMRSHSRRLSIISNTFSTGALASTHFTSPVTRNTITLTTPKQQATTHESAERVDTETIAVAEQSNEQPLTELKKSSSNTSLMLSVSQALEEEFERLDSSTLTVDVHDSMTQDVNKHASQVYGMDISHTETLAVADPQIAQSNEQPLTELKKSLSNTSMMLSVSQALDEQFKKLTLTVDVHDSMTQDVNKHTSQMYGMDISPTAVDIDFAKNITHLNQNASHTASPEKNDIDEQSFSTGSDSDDTDNSDDDETDFSLFRMFKKRRKAKKKVPVISDTYEVKKSLWQMQEESIAMQDKIDPIRDMEDTNTTFTGKKADETSDMKTKESEGIDSHKISTSPDHNEPSADEVTVIIKVKHLSDISSFTPQNLFCCILVDDVKKATTNVKTIQGTDLDFNEQFYIDLLPGTSELQIKICKPAEEDRGAVEHVLSTGTVKLPGINRRPEELSLETGSTGILTIDIQVLPLEY